MLFYLDESLLEYLNTKEISSEDIESLKRLALNYEYNYYLLTGNVDVLNYLRNCSQLDEETKKIFQGCFSSIFTHHSSFQNIYTKVIITPSNMEFFKQQKTVHLSFTSLPYDYFEFYCPLNMFVVPEKLQAVRFVSEHLDDVKFYEYLANNFRYDSPFNFRFDRVHGGGIDTGNQMIEKIENDYLVLTVVDSDQKKPDGRFGDTALTVKKLFEEHENSSISEYEILKVHEKENLISPEIYSYILDNFDEVVSQKLNLILKSNNDKISHFFNHFDYKEGLSFKNYHSDYDFIFEIEGIINKFVSSCPEEESIFFGDREKLCKELEIYNSLKTSKEKNDYNKFLIKKLSSNPLSKFNNIKNNIERYKNQFNNLNGSEDSCHREDLSYKINLLSNLNHYLLPFQKDYINLLSLKIREWGIYTPINTIDY